MVARINRIIGTGDFSLLVNEKADAIGMLRLGIRARAVSKRDLAIGVA